MWEDFESHSNESYLIYQEHHCHQLYVEALIQISILQIKLSLLRRLTWICKVLLVIFFLFKWVQRSWGKFRTHWSVSLMLQDKMLVCDEEDFSLSSTMNRSIASWVMMGGLLSNGSDTPAVVKVLPFFSNDSKCKRHKDHVFAAWKELVLSKSAV